MLLQNVGDAAFRPHDFLGVPAGVGDLEVEEEFLDLLVGNGVLLLVHDSYEMIKLII